MNLFQTFKDLVGHGFVRTVHGLAAGMGRVLLGMQAVLAWLDGPHPVATRLKPITTFLTRYPRAIATTLGGGLLAIAGGAFAVVSLGPDAADMPVSTLTETVIVPTLEQQAQALELHELKLLRSDTTVATETAESLLRRLPPMTQQVFNLFALDGFSHREISEMLGMSEGTSKWHVNHARKQLQAWIKTEMNPAI